MAATYAQIGQVVAALAGAGRVGVSMGDFASLAGALPSGAFVDPQGRIRAPVTAHNVLCGGFQGSLATQPQWLFIEGHVWISTNQIFVL